MRQTIARIEPWLSPLLAFSGTYFVFLIVFSLAARAATHSGDLVLNHLLSLSAAISATVVCVLGFDRGRSSLGLFVPVGSVARGIVRGVLVAAFVVVGAHLMMILLSDYRHLRGAGFDWALVLTLILPAAVGEELLFRGYVLQKLYRVNRGWAVLVTSLLFALAHGGNPAVNALAFTNILLAGVLLALMWAWDGTLWMPIAGHISWNVISGPILGHELSGLVLSSTVLAELDHGPAWVTGGDFGIEGSVLMTLTEAIAVAFLARRIQSRDRALRQGAPDDRIVPGGVPDSSSGGRKKSSDEVNGP
jgi:membrane protease YdiL (CAAX protease family)